ncbi:MAG: hypothetical protein IPI55_16480 [Flavobacteriales bacterium]|nr:hypothetical protein [Flavobacteriales bacterium]
MAIAPVQDKSVTVGVVLLADPVGAQDADFLSSQSHVAVALMAGNKVMGNALGSLEGVRVEGSPTAFGKPERPQDPLPLLHGGDGQWYGKALPVVDAWPSLKVVVAVPFAPAFSSLAEFQLWSLAMGLLGFILAVLWTLLIGRTVDAPLRRIVDHLSAFNQGQNEGMLPEGAMSGPYVRLAKLINMVLEKRNPSVMAAATPPGRGGVSNVDALLSAPPAPAGQGAPPRTFDLDAAAGQRAFVPASPAAPMQGGGLGDLFSDAPSAPAAPTDDPFAAFGPATSAPPPTPLFAPTSPTVIAPAPQPPVHRPPPPPPPPHTFGGEPPLRQEATVMMQIPQELLDATLQPQASRPPTHHTPAPPSRTSSMSSMAAASGPPRGALRLPRPVKPPSWCRCHKSSWRAPAWTRKRPTSGTSTSSLYAPGSSVVSRRMT